MKYTEYVKANVGEFDSAAVELLRDLIVDEYIILHILEKKDVTKEILEEKICDYFEKLEIRTGKSFEKQIESYMDDMESIVESQVLKTPTPKKNDPTPVEIPRARKYLEKALSIKKNINHQTFSHLQDYSRLMMCLYMAEIKSRHKMIANFEFSAECLEPEIIIKSMKKEGFVYLLGKRTKLGTKEIYGTDACTIVLAIIELCSIINNSGRGDN